MLAVRRNMCAAVRKQHPQLAQLELTQGFRIGMHVPPHAAQRIGMLEAEDAPVRDRAGIKATPARPEVACATSVASDIRLDTITSPGPGNRSSVPPLLNARPLAPNGGTPVVASSGSVAHATAAPPKGPVRQTMPWNESEI